MQKERLMELAGVQLNENEAEFKEVVHRMKKMEFWIPESMEDYEKHKYAIKAMAKELADEIK